MNNAQFGDDTFEKAAEAGYTVQQKAKKALSGSAKKLVKEFSASIAGHSRTENAPQNFDRLTSVHLNQIEKNYEAQDAQKMENLKAILFKRVNEESAQAVRQREREEQERLRLMEEEAMRDQQEKDQEQGNGFVSAPAGKVRRNVLGGQTKKNSQAETRGGKSQF